MVAVADGMGGVWVPLGEEGGSVRRILSHRCARAEAAADEGRGEAGDGLGRRAASIGERERERGEGAGAEGENNGDVRR